MLEIKIGGEWVTWTGQRDNNGILYPGNIESLWSDEDLSAAGFRRYVEPPPLPPTKIDLQGYAAAKRYAVETGGVTVGGVPIPSDRDTQAKLTAAFLLAQVNPQATFQWKAGAGFVTLDAASVGQIAVAIGEFVQAAYATESQVAAAIIAGTITTTAQIDAAAWPA